MNWSKNIFSYIVSLRSREAEERQGFTKPACFFRVPHRRGKNTFVKIQWGKAWIFRGARVHIQILYTAEGSRTQQKSLPAPMVGRREQASYLTAKLQLSPMTHSILWFLSGRCTVAVQWHHSGLPNFFDICNICSAQICSLKKSHLFLSVHW